MVPSLCHRRPIICCVLCKLSIHPLGAVHPCSTAAHAAQREFGKNPKLPSQGLPPLPPSLPQFRLPSLHTFFLETQNSGRSDSKLSPIMIARNISRHLLCADARIFTQCPCSSLRLLLLQRTQDPCPARGPRPSSRQRMSQFVLHSKVHLLPTTNFYPLFFNEDGSIGKIPLSKLHYRFRQYTRFIKTV